MSAGALSKECLKSTPGEVKACCKKAGISFHGCTFEEPAQDFAHQETAPILQMQKQRVCVCYGVCFYGMSAFMCKTLGATFGAKHKVQNWVLGRAVLV